MYKLLLYLLLTVFIITLNAQQIDQELAIHTLFQGKHAVNRAAHAAAQQIDQSLLPQGIYAINEGAAAQAALLYLTENLRLDEMGSPLPGSFLKERVDVMVFEIINYNDSFPFVYENPEYNYSVTLQKPGVILIIRLHYPRIYNLIEPIVWDIKGTAELAY